MCNLAKFVLPNLGLEWKRFDWPERVEALRMDLKWCFNVLQTNLVRKQRENTVKDRCFSPWNFLSFFLCHLAEQEGDISENKSKVAEELGIYKVKKRPFIHRGLCIRNYIHLPSLYFIYFSLSFFLLFSYFFYPSTPHCFSGVYWRWIK